MNTQLLEMLELQEELNKKINKYWRKERTKEDFIRATWIECAEAVDSLPWKWWKKQEANLDNLKIEVVDIWHFIMSYILLDYEDLGKALESDYIKIFKKGINEDFQNIEINAVYIHHYLGETDYHKKLIFLIERVAEGFLKNEPLEGIFFFGLLVKNTISFKDLYLLYIGKNILNHIRQETGYKEGSYKKVINGMEDNQYLFEIVKEVNTKEELEERIRNLFKNLQSEV
jgi:NTP pyrophosphatase (non-canonical NTP hydrolase)